MAETVILKKPYSKAVPVKASLDPDASSGLDLGVAILRLMAEPTRLRILHLLRHGEVSVKDLTQILAHSQPRISRHMKLLCEGGLVRRFPEGAWVYYRLNESGHGASIMHSLIHQLGDSDVQLKADLDRLKAQKAQQHSQALVYFNKVAQAWDQMQCHEVPQKDIEQAILSVLGDKKIAHMLDLGTGTGRMLELLAPLYGKATGLDSSQAMIRAARAHIEMAQLTKAQVRLADFTQTPHNLGTDEQGYDLVVLHQVLHYFDDPLYALKKAKDFVTARGRLFVVDYGPHDYEKLRTHYAHRRLGFSKNQMRDWAVQLGLQYIQHQMLVPTLSHLKAAESKKRASKNLQVHLWLFQNDPT